MGSVCTSAKSVDKNAIVPTATLALRAKEHLKTLQANEAPFDDSRLSSSMKKRRLDRGDDLLSNTENEKIAQVARKHESLWVAVEANDIPAAERFLDQNEVEELNMYDATGQTMIHKAAALGYTEMLILLLERTGAKPDLVNSQLATPLHLACRGNKENIVKFLIGCGVDANVQDENGQTPLLITAIHGHTQLATLLVESSISGILPESLEIDIKDHRGLTSLNCASIKGELGLIQLLVQRGGANTNQSSPKGCTPLMYAGRGGFQEAVQYLLAKKASPLKQDSSGGTVFHHAVEKGHLNVLEVMLQQGVDVYSAIEIADNAGRTPIFEALESTFDTDDEVTAMRTQTDIIRILTSKKQQGGFGAKVNVINYGGQTPLYSAARQGNIESVKLLVELGSELDLNRGELVKVADQGVDQESYESMHEQCFMDAFMNTMTPLHIATVMGFDEIALYLIEKGANVNLRSNVKGYTPLHMAVLANKPEMLIELLTKTNADPMVEDASGRTLLDMVYQYIPSYLDSFQLLLEHLYESRQSEGINRPSDDRRIEGMAQLQSIQPDSDQYQEMFVQRVEVDEHQLFQDPASEGLSFANTDVQDIQLEENAVVDPLVESVFGHKAAIYLLSVNWKHKELALKHILKQTERTLGIGRMEETQNIGMIIKAVIAVVSIASMEKVIKVLNGAINLLGTVVQAQKVEQDAELSQTLKESIISHQLISKLLQKSEESNTVVTKKIHEALLDLSYNPKIGEDLVSHSILQQIAQHYDHKAINPKGLLVQLALLFKFVASFGIHIPSDEPSSASVLTVTSVLNASVPAVAVSNVDVKNAATKIILEVQKLSGAVKEGHLQTLPDKTKESILKKVAAVDIEPLANDRRKQDPSMVMSGAQTSQVLSQMVDAAKQINVVNVGEPDQIDEKAQALKRQLFSKSKEIFEDKMHHKDWQVKEEALTAMLECFECATEIEIQDNERFVTDCTILLKDSLETNNMQVYMAALQVASVFLDKALHVEAVKEAMQSFIKAIVLHTTDTNTRVRKKSVDLINQIWNHEASLKQASSKGSEETSASAVIAAVLTDSSLQEKAIVGRLGLFIKKALLIENGDDLNNMAHHLILGKDYEQLTEFACAWCMHKNTKVRQCALKLIVEICRLNHIDPRGGPFKQRIINFILALRPSLRDPLVAKINEVCALEHQSSQSNQEAPKKKLKTDVFINLSQFELGIATTQRSVSLDVRRGIKQSGQSIRQFPSMSPNLPSISGALPGISSTVANAMPTIVLPHSEPLTETQLKQSQPFLEVFGLEVITCFLSHNWASRQAAMQKVEEQLHNFDPRRRDAMYGEINRTNQPPEVSYKVFLMFAEEGIKDVNLNNYLMILQLVQKAMPIYFRYLQPPQIKRELMPLASLVIRKCSDMKAKVREASINFCLHLSHQSPIGPETMVDHVLAELQSIDKKPSDKLPTDKSSQNYSNNNLVASCLQLLCQLQQQTNIVSQPDSQMFNEYMNQTNIGLRNQNNAVKKQAEILFKLLFAEFGEQALKRLEGQKPQLVTKLVSEAKQESSQAKDRIDGTFSCAIGVLSEEEKAKQRLNFVQSQIREDSLNTSEIRSLLDGHEILINQLKLPNSSKRVKAIVEIKKVIQQKLSKLNAQSASTLLEPLTTLTSMLLKDDDVEVCIEALTFLKFIVGGLAPHLSSLDLHLIIGSFLSSIVNHNSLENVRVQLTSNKLVIFLAKHPNVGSFVVAKEVVKLIERINKATQTPEGCETLLKLYGILQMLIQQFSIVLCYQPQFYQQTLEQIADTMLLKVDSQSLKSACTAIIISLHQIDVKLLDSGISKLDLARKTPLKKVVIEFENVSKRGQAQQVNLNAHEDAQLKTLHTQRSNQPSRHQPFVAGQDKDISPDQSMRDTLQSFNSSKMSPTSVLKSRRFKESDSANNTFYSQQSRQQWDERQRNSEVRLSNRSDIMTLQHQISEAPKLTATLKSNGPSLADRVRQSTERKATDFVLPEIGDQSSRRRGTMQTMNALDKGRKVGAGFKRDATDDNFTGKNNTNFVNQGPLTITAGLASFQAQPKDDAPLYMPSAMERKSISKAADESPLDSIRPPLYVPSKRTNTLEKTPVQQQSQDYKSLLYKNVSAAEPKVPTRVPSRDNLAVSRYQPTQMQPQQKVSSKLKPPAPTAASFQIKDSEYAQPKQEERKDLF